MGGYRGDTTRMKRLPKPSPYVAALIIAWVAFRHRITTAILWLFRHTSAWLLGYLSVPEILTIAGIVFVGGGLSFVLWSNIRGHRKARQLVFDGLLMQVELAEENVPQKQIDQTQ